MKNLLKSIWGILSYTFTSILCMISFLVFILIFDIGFGPSLFATLFLGTVLYFLIGKRKQEKKKAAKQQISDDLHRITQSQEGMSKEETQFFRETMNTAKNQILILEKNMHQVTKLKTIESRNNTIQLTKALFKEITNEPRRLHQVDKFLYSHLPSLVDLTEKYIEISNHEVKNKTTFEVLDKSASTIDEMCQLIAVDYASFKAEDLENMDLEIELAKQAIERDNESNENTENNEF
ncbi:5-bromo-4-chloroindolyl phosphate hydrolysis family protein [Carnobacterium gallinarum]|uniref:5-bromo-4-chloroindolyl phosphate hydrolysis family protein n=1 Tax=Carnobacterium gallinarum TaxID=2749 RepID=UPI0005542A2C|nr:5-bromo-4-chloroindolyl phosphate hydrolysis family protein [Carnobacterium gallinarum]